MLILNKYIFTFLCYLHVYILKVIKEANRVPVHHSEEDGGRGVPVNGCCIKNKLKSPYAALVFGMLTRIDRKTVP